MNLLLSSVSIIAKKLLISNSDGILLENLVILADADLRRELFPDLVDSMLHDSLLVVVVIIFLRRFKFEMRY